MSLCAVMTVGVDRPGNLSAVAGVLVEQGCNIEECEMAVLRGYSAMMLVVTTPQSLDAPGLAGALEAALAERELSVTVHAVNEVAVGDTKGVPWAVSMQGADRPGIVFEVTRLLSQSGINISGLKTRLRGGDASGYRPPGYTMALEVVVPPEVDGDAVADRLDHLARQLNVACSMRPAAEGR